jgi:hypothetical protein
MSTEAVVFVKDLLEARFPAEEVRQDYRGNDYVEDERVMDRLTEVLGNENWHIADATAISDRVVRLSVAVRWPGTTEWLTYTDFGYPNKKEAEEPLKEAWTDAFRRVGRLIGIARYLYLGEGPAGRTGNTQGQGVATGSVAAQNPSGDGASQPVQTVAPAAPQQPVAAEPPPLPPGAVRYQDIEEHGKCPAHGTPWTIKPAGEKRDGSGSYPAFYKCDGRGADGSYCKQKPPKAWAEAHPIAG